MKRCYQTPVEYIMGFDQLMDIQCAMAFLQLRTILRVFIYVYLAMTSWNYCRTGHSSTVFFLYILINLQICCFSSLLLQSKLQRTVERSKWLVVFDIIKSVLCVGEYFCRKYSNMAIMSNFLIIEVSNSELALKTLM